MPKHLLPVSLLGALIVVTALLIAGGQTPMQASAGAAHASPERVSANPTWGIDIRVSPTNTEDLVAQRNLSLAVDPTNPNNVVASYDNYVNAGAHTAFSRSTDGGLTWTGGRIPEVGSQQMVPQSNAGVAYDATGTAYLVTFGITSTQSGFFSLTATNGVLNTPVPIVVADFSEFRSQPSMAVDPRPNGQNVYSFWVFTNNTGQFFQGIWMRYSHDKGRTWNGADIRVSDPGNEISFGPDAAAAFDGTVYVASQQLITYSIDIQPKLYLDRSTDGGMTWGTDRLIGGGPITKIGVPDYKGRELTLPGSENCSLIRMHHFPHIAVAPNAPNTVYAVWNDGRWDSSFTNCTGTGKHSDIAFSRTTDGGVTWSAPTRVNDDPQGNGMDQFQPAIDVRADGTIGVIWYDRRYDAAHPYYYNLAYSQSTDGGATWSPNVRVSDRSSNPDSLTDVKGIDDLGYRLDVAYGPDFALPGWQTAEEFYNHGDFMVDRGALPPNATASPTRTTVPTSTTTSTSTRTALATSTATAQSSPSRTATTQATQAASATSTMQATTTATTATPCAMTFTDVPADHTFYPFIRCLACRGVISGYADGTFRPGNEITRGQIAKMVSNAAGFSNDPGPQIYEDVAVGSTFYTWVNRLSSRGVMSGYQCGLAPEEPCVGPDNRPYFRPNSNATRGQLAKIVANAASLGGEPTGQFYADVQEGHTFYLWIMRLTQLGAMSGYPCGGENEPCDGQNRPYFRPFNNVTRGQASKIVANTFFPDCRTPGR